MAQPVYKVLTDEGHAHHGGRGTWPLPNGKPGDWLEVKGELVPCQRGLHLCRKGDLIHWLGPAIFIAEYDGERIVHENKIVVRRARLVERVNAWNERTARLFAADCAERALKRIQKRGIWKVDERSWRAVEIARLYAYGTVPKSDLDAAGDAAWAAVRDAAWAAVRDAARAAAWAAAWDAVRDAARTAARAAAWAAARDAAWAAARAAAREAERDAERRWQTKRLFEYLDGTRS